MENQKNWVPSIVVLIFILGLSYPPLGKTMESTPNWDIKDIFLYPFIPLLIFNGCILGPIIKKKITSAVVIFVSNETYRWP
jgi:hypothetical protein